MKILGVLGKFYELRVVAMRVARPFKNIQLFLFNSLRAVLGMGNEDGLACYGFDKSSFGCCVGKIKRQVQALGLGLGLSSKW
jgi:hypothetical protein